MTRSLLCLPVFLIGLGFASETPATERRIKRFQDSAKVALVIGNDSYPKAPLVNGVNDAVAMAEVLRKVGFEVIVVQNADQRSLDRAVASFIERLTPGDIALAYYAGHGVQVEMRNYLVPVDYRANGEAEVKYRAYPVDLLREHMESSGSALNILILDACRDNPFAGARSSRRGLAQTQTGKGTFIAFSTAPGKTATDNPGGGNGLFTRELLKTLNQVGLNLDEVFNEVRKRVYEASAGKQIPWTASSLLGTFYFRPPSTESYRPGIAQPAAARTGSIGVTVDLEGAGIALDGEWITNSRRREEIHIDEVPTGRRVVSVSKQPYPEVTRVVNVQPGATVRIAVDLRVDDIGDRFCRRLQRVLDACPDGFKTIAKGHQPDSDRAFLETHVALPGAWYNKIFKLTPSKTEFLSSFELEPGTSPSELLEHYISKVDRCLPDYQVVGSERNGDRHLIDVRTRNRPCEVGVSIDGPNIDIDVYDYNH